MIQTKFIGYIDIVSHSAGAENLRYDFSKENNTKLKIVLCTSCDVA
jgi:hypothetical protein